MVVTVRGPGRGQAGHGHVWPVRNGGPQVMGSWPAAPFRWPMACSGPCGHRSCGPYAAVAVHNRVHAAHAGSAVMGLWSQSVQRSAHGP
jgi:hypothetical protein